MSPPDELELWLSALKNVRKTSDGYEASCPIEEGHAHDDRRRSLTITRGTDVAVLVTCHKADEGHTFEAIRARLGIPVAGGSGSGSWAPEDVHVYTDESGAPLFEVGRFPGKRFLQRRPGREDWKGGIKGVRRVLYRLPKVIEAARDGATIYLPEGEKDVHAFERAGCAATCNPMGAGKWRPEYAESLRGAHVVVVQDRDEDGTGQRHARTVVASLQGVAASVRLVEAAHGKDAADHFAAGLGVDDFMEVDITEPVPKNLTTIRKNIVVPEGDLTLAVARALNAYQAMTDTDPIRATLAVAVTSVLDGEPLWLQLVGSPSSGKSEAISMLRHVVDGRIGEVTVPGLLGWVGGAKGRPTGLLHRIGDGHRLITITDFSTVLADSDRGRRAVLFSFLRVLYDGHAHRENSSAPRPLEWEGRLTVVSAVTPQIDAFSAHADALGPRWIYMRMAEPTAAERKRAAGLARRHATRKEQLRDAARDAAAAAIEAAQAQVADVDVNEVDGEWIDDAAIIATLVRSDVPRDGYGLREISGPATREEPPRMAIMLAVLFRGLVALGLPNRTARRIMLRCALDSTPLTRRHVLAVLSTGDTLNTSEIARAADLDRKVARFALEELEALGVVRSTRVVGSQEYDDEDPRQRRQARNWTLQGDEGKLAARLIDEVRRNVEYPPPLPPDKGDKGYGSSHLGEGPRPAPWGPGSLADAELEARRAQRGGH
jgi:hypothetical protein